MTGDAIPHGRLPLTEGRLTCSRLIAMAVERALYGAPPTRTGAPATNTDLE